MAGFLIFVPWPILQNSSNRNADFLSYFLLQMNYLSLPTRELANEILFLHKWILARDIFGTRVEPSVLVAFVIILDELQDESTS